MDSLNYIYIYNCIFNGCYSSRVKSNGGSQYCSYHKRFVSESEKRKYSSAIKTLQNRLQKASERRQMQTVSISVNIVYCLGFC
jgi:hypothetical protein